MNRRFMLTAICVLATVATSFQSVRASGGGPKPATLSIRVVDVRNRKGDLIFGVFQSADGFPTEKGKSVNWQVKPARSGVVFTAELPPGRYSASVLHDENSNGKMDFGPLGIPLEGYGMTNNPKPKLRKATFDEARFTLPPKGADLTISIQYFN